MKFILSTFTVLLIGIVSVSGQNVPSAKLRVFIDGCGGGTPGGGGPGGGGGRGCDLNYIRTEVTAVDFFLDNKEADVFVLINNNQSGGGGRQYQMLFYGQQGVHKGKRDTLYLATKQTDTDFEVREKITRYLKSGLAPFVAKTEAGENLDISMKSAAPATSEANKKIVASPVDKWNYWVFNVGGNFDANAQELSRQLNVGGNFSASRITNNFKIQFSTNYNQNYRTTIRRKQVVIDDVPQVDENGVPILEETVNRFDVSNYGFKNQVVKTLSQHWSTGFDLEGSQNTRFNYNFQVRFRPALEYNFFPESQQNSRFLRVNYGIEGRVNSYVNPTRNGKLDETVFLHSFLASVGYTQRWGRLEVGYRYRNYLHNLNLWTTGMSINTNIRVTGNLSFNINMEGNYVKDQIYLAAGDYSESDILSGRVTLPSNYTLQTRFGFNYRFGSNFNNFVNQRFFGRANFVGND